MPGGVDAHPETNAGRPRRPVISVVISTYNRSYVLKHAIRSVLAQDFADFELLVIGDGCTDDTEAVVASFDDPRLLFWNLARNYGEQSGPNNVGVARARGRYIAFLNHDDVWFRDHLSILLDRLQATDADIVHSVSAAIKGSDPLSWKAAWSPPGTGPFFDPFTQFCGVSNWLVKASVFRRIGRFRPATELYCEPTQDFLFRAWRRGFVHRNVSELTVIVVVSSDRPNSYLERDSPEHDLIAGLIDQPQFRADLLERIAIQRPPPPLPAHLRWSLRPLAWLGIPPRVVHLFSTARRLRRGAVIVALREQRGLDRLHHDADVLGNLRAKEIAIGPRYRLGERVSLRDKDSPSRVKEWGWSYPEPSGTWTDGGEASLAFNLGRRERGALELLIEAWPFTPPGLERQRVDVLVEDRRLAQFACDANTSLLRVRIPVIHQPHRDVLRITLKLPDAISPKKAGASEDIRELAINVRAVELRSSAEPDAS